VNAGRARNGGRVLLLLASRDPQSAEQIAATSRLSTAETVRQIRRLTDQGFIVAESSADAEVSVYVVPSPVHCPGGRHARGDC
jgi:DNA-binding MarR family transcriptional regulator